jgi:hypothetical protein
MDPSTAEGGKTRYRCMSVVRYANQFRFEDSGTARDGVHSTTLGPNSGRIVEEVKIERRITKRGRVSPLGVRVVVTRVFQCGPLDGVKNVTVVMFRDHHVSNSDPKLRGSSESPSPHSASSWQAVGKQCARGR